MSKQNRKFTDRDYSIPSENKYMKLAPGDNKFRILSDIITGFEEWKDEGEKRVVVRVREDDQDTLGPDKKYFIAGVVYNYLEGREQILILTQISIIARLRELILNDSWGDLSDYDITVKKIGQGMNTRYTVTPEPKDILNPGVSSTYKADSINLTRLYEGKDPFGEET